MHWSSRGSSCWISCWCRSGVFLLLPTSTCTLYLKRAVRAPGDAPGGFVRREELGVGKPFGELPIPRAGRCGVPGSPCSCRHRATLKRGCAWPRPQRWLPRARHKRSLCREVQAKGKILREAGEGGKQALREGSTARPESSLSAGFCSPWTCPAMLPAQRGCAGAGGSSDPGAPQPARRLVPATCPWAGCTACSGDPHHPAGLGPSPPALGWAVPGPTTRSRK